MWGSSDQLPVLHHSSAACAPIASAQDAPLGGCPAASRHSRHLALPPPLPCCPQAPLPSCPAAAALTTGAAPSPAPSSGATTRAAAQSLTTGVGGCRRVRSGCHPCRLEVLPHAQALPIALDPSHTRALLQALRHLRHHRRRHAHGGFPRVVRERACKCNMAPAAGAVDRIRALTRPPAVPPLQQRVREGLGLHRRPLPQGACAGPGGAAGRATCCQACLPLQCTLTAPRRRHLQECLSERKLQCKRLLGNRCEKCHRGTVKVKATWAPATYYRASAGFCSERMRPLIGWGQALPRPGLHAEAAREGSRHLV